MIKRTGLFITALFHIPPFDCACIKLIETVAAFDCASIKPIETYGAFQLD